MQTALESVDTLVEYYGVNLLTIEDRSYFQSVFSQMSQPISDYSFTNNFMWVNSFKMFWKVISKHLCLFVIEDECLHMFLPPCPERGATLDDLREAIIESFKMMNDYNERHGKYFIATIQYVSSEMMDKINSCGVDGIIAAPSPMGKDYIYDMQKMITLSGSQLDSKRHARNKFMREYKGFYTREITSCDKIECLKLLSEWYDHKNIEGGVTNSLDSGYYLDPERHACDLVMTHSFALGLKGMGLFVKDKMVGFTYGEALSKTQASIILEKTHPDYYGASAYIFSEFCRQYWSDYNECNAGDHSNNPNLKFTKQQYRPSRLIDKSVIMQACPIGFRAQISNDRLSFHSS